MLAEAAVWGFSDKFIPATITRGHFSTIINLDKDGLQKIFATKATREPLRPSRRACKAMYSRYGDVSHRELLIWYNVFPCKWLWLSLFISVIPNNHAISVRACRSAALPGLDLKWWLMQFLPVGCHSHPLPAFILTTNTSLESQRSPGSRRAKQLLSFCLSDWQNVSVEKKWCTSLLRVRECVFVCAWEGGVTYDLLCCIAPVADIP